ncbi:MAG: GHMP kinase, partial [Proteobacteria bacterium]|nr:GHMP kinase [Pseudomonadota bacterium]
MRAPAYDRVSVLVPARLHLGFLDLNGGLGRRYGGLGLTLEGIHTRLRLEPSEDLSGRGPSSERALDYIGRLVGALGLSGAVKVTVDEAIPEHVGLGSGTQMALAAGTGTARLYGLDVEPR